MDKSIGRILAQLERDGLADNTVVMFFGDNGRIEPRGIHWCYDTGLHVPMIIHWPKIFPVPGNYRAGSVSDEVISLIDLTPTTLGFAGIERPLGMHGRAFLGDELAARDPSIAIGLVPAACGGGADQHLGAGRVSRTDQEPVGL